METLSAEIKDKLLERLSQINADGPVPGLSCADVMEAGIFDMNDVRLDDLMLHARVAYWLKPNVFNLRRVKEKCWEAGVPRSGSKKVLALRLALKKLPASVDDVDLPDDFLNYNKENIPPYNKSKKASPLVRKKAQHTKHHQGKRACKNCGATISP